MIDKIYEVISDKTLSFWCRVWHNIVQSYIVSSAYTRYIWKYRMVDLSVWSFEKCHKQWIIWHPVYIGNIISYIKTVTPNALEADLYNKWNKYVFEFEDVSVMKLLSLRDDMNTTIDEQNEWCIRYVYDLITKQ